MRKLRSIGALGALFGVCLGALGCGASSQGAESNVAGGSESFEASRALPTEPEPPEFWPGWAEASSWPAVFSQENRAEAPSAEAPPGAERFVSLGHGSGRYQISVHLAPDQRELYRGLVVDSQLPDGFQVYVRHFEAAGQGEVEPVAAPNAIFAMRKHRAGWEFSRLSAAGEKDRTTPVEACRRCHAESASDHLFGLPQKY